jgi:hypothetical protein
MGVAIFAALSDGTCIAAANHAHRITLEGESMRKRKANPH